MRVPYPSRAQPGAQPRPRDCAERTLLRAVRQCHAFSAEPLEDDDQALSCASSVWT